MSVQPLNTDPVQPGRRRVGWLAAVVVLLLAIGILVSWQRGPGSEEVESRGAGQEPEGDEQDLLRGLLMLRPDGRLDTLDPVDLQIRSLGVAVPGFEGDPSSARLTAAVGRAVYVSGSLAGDPDAPGEHEIVALDPTTGDVTILGLGTDPALASERDRLAFASGGGREITVLGLVDGSETVVTVAEVGMPESDGDAEIVTVLWRPGTAQIYVGWVDSASTGGGLYDLRSDAYSPLWQQDGGAGPLPATFMDGGRLLVSQPDAPEELRVISLDAAAANEEVPVTLPAPGVVEELAAVDGELFVLVDSEAGLSAVTPSSSDQPESVGPYDLLAWRDDGWLVIDQRVAAIAEILDAGSEPVPTSTTVPGTTTTSPTVTAPSATTVPVDSPERVAGERWRSAGCDFKRLADAGGDVVAWAPGSCPVTMFDGTTGEVLWEAAGSGAVVADDVVLFYESEVNAGSSTVTLAAVDRRTGAEIWRLGRAGGIGIDGLVVEGALVYALLGDVSYDESKIEGGATPEPGEEYGSSEETLIALDIETGDIVWERPSRAPILWGRSSGVAQPFTFDVGPGLLALYSVGDYQSADDWVPPTMALLDPATGDQLGWWQAGPINNWLHVDSELVLVHSGNELTALTSPNGAVAWSVPLSFPGGTTLDAESARLLVHDLAGVRLLEADSGTLRWEFPVDADPGELFFDMGLSDVALAHGRRITVVSDATGAASLDLSLPGEAGAVALGADRVYFLTGERSAVQLVAVNR